MVTTTKSKVGEKIVLDTSAFSSAKTSTELTTVTQNTISQLSNRNATDYKNITEKLLENQKIVSAGELGQQINELINTAAEFDPSKLNRGLLGKLKAKLFGMKQQLFANSGSVQSRIDEIVSRIDKQLHLHETRQQDIYELYEYNRSYHDDLLVNIQTGEEIMEILKAKEAEFETELQENPDSFVAQDLKTLRNQMIRLQTTIDNFKNGTLLSKQTAAELELLKESGLDIFETVKSAKNSLIPIWKMALIKYIVAQEQGQTIQFADNLKKAHSEAIAKAGAAVSTTSVDAARLASSTVISIEDLAKLNNNLIETGKKVDQIHAEYEQKRKVEEERREQLEAELYEHIVGKNAN